MASHQDKQYEYLLSLIQKIETKNDSQLMTNTLNNNTELVSLQEQITSLSAKFDSISFQFSTIKLKTEKIDEFTSFISKANDLLTTHEIRINNVLKDLTNSKYKYDKIFLDNLVVPGFIGDYCKYKNLKEYLDFNIKEMSMLTNYKEKTTLDLKQYKEKIEGVIKEFQRQTSLFSSQQQAKCNKVKEEAFDYIDKCRNDFYGKYDELQVFNSKYYNELKDKASQLNSERVKILNIKEEINERFDNTVNEIRLDNRKTIDEMKVYSGEFNLIKRKFAELIEFIKDVRFRKNLVSFEEVKKREITQLSQKLKFNNPRRKSVENANYQKQIDLKYDIFTGKDTQSSDEDISVKTNTINVRNIQKAAIPLIRNNNYKTIDNSNNVVDKGFKDNNQCSPITEDPFDSSPQIIKKKKSAKCDDYIIGLKSQFLFKEEDIKDENTVLKQNQSPNCHNFYHNKRVINLNSTSNKFYNSQENINKLRNQMNQTGSIYSNTNPNSNLLNVNSSTSKLPVKHRKQQSHFNSSISQQIEGKLVTLHFKESNQQNCLINYDNQETIEVLLKPTEEANRRDSKRFKTVKENNQVVNKLFYSQSPDNKNHRRQNASKDKKQKEVIECYNKPQLHYELVDKVLTNVPNMKNHGDDQKEV